MSWVAPFTTTYYVHLWVRFSIQNVVLRVSGRKNSKIFPCGVSFSCVFDEIFTKFHQFHKPPFPPCPEKFLVPHLHSGIILFAKRSILNIWQLLSNLYSDLMLYTASDTFRILANSALCFLCICRNIQSYSLLMRHIQVYETLLRHIQAYSGISSTLCNPCILVPLHFLSPSIFRTGDLFKTLWNVEQVYLEPRIFWMPGALFSHVQVYSELYATLTYEKTWHTRNPGIFKTLP